METECSILERIINPALGDFSGELARTILALDFPPVDHARYIELSAKAGTGELTDDERDLLEEYLDVNDFLTILKAKARASLSHIGSAA